MFCGLVVTDSCDETRTVTTRRRAPAALWIEARRQRRRSPETRASNAQRGRRWDPDTWKPGHRRSGRGAGSEEGAGAADALPAGARCGASTRPDGFPRRSTRTPERFALKRGRGEATRAVPCGQRSHGPPPGEERFESARSQFGDLGLCKECVAPALLPASHRSRSRRPSRGRPTLRVCRRSRSASFEEWEEGVRAQPRWRRRGATRIPSHHANNGAHQSPTSPPERPT